MHCARLPGSIMKKIGDTRPIFIEHNTKKIRKSCWYRPYTPCQRSPRTRSIARVWIPSHIANITDLQNKKISNRKLYTISSHNHTHLMKKHTLAEFHVERATPRARFLAREKIRESAKFKNLKKYLSLNCCSSRKKMFDGLRPKLSHQERVVFGLMQSKSLANGQFERPLSRGAEYLRFHVSYRRHW